ncbi:hypothetical protein ATO13_23351 [Stappia sp. 22II-S9-Z10]|nr:hypothetical protein ATO13_23351 [Stappia sp. 22II-S9-Z10]
MIATRFAPVPSRSPMRFFIAACADGDFPSGLAVGVGQPASITVFGSSAFPTPADPRPSDRIGVGQPLTSATVLRLLSVFPAGL